jgi:hypothetical protein
MLDFMLALERLLKIWPDNTKLDVTKIAEMTKTKVYQAVEYLSETLNKEIDIHEPMSFNEISKARALMQETLRGEIEKRRRIENEEIQNATMSFQQTMEKVRHMQTSRNWRSAYKTLEYFYGKHRDRLSTDIVVTIADECLRSGVKDQANFQELSCWLQRGVAALLRSNTHEVIEEALDFVDAYGDYFLDKNQEKGEELLKNIFLMLKPSAMEFDLTPKFNDIALGLKLNHVVDVYV